METVRILRAAALALVLLLAGATGALAHDTTLPGAVVEQSIYEVLSPHGEWLVVAPYGRVWRPRVDVVGYEFAPYSTGGQWIYTELGWSFESTWEWGWMPFHYGRWAMVQGAGWVWVPDVRWSPAWVDWRSGGGYVGWAPLPPGAMVAVGLTAGWTFVEERYFAEPDFVLYAVPPPVLVHVYRMSTPVRVVVRGSGHRWYRGPPVHRISSASGAALRPARIHAPPPGRIERPAPRREQQQRPFLRPPGFGRPGDRSMPPPRTRVEPHRRPFVPPVRPGRPDRHDRRR